MFDNKPNDQTLSLKRIMSWLFKSLQASDADGSPQPQSHSSSIASEYIRITASDPSVKNDLSSLSETLSRQLRGVANFLAPPPSSTAFAAVDSSASGSSPPSSSHALIGIRNDLAEISGSLRTGLSLLSVNSNKAVGEISRFASNLLPFPSHSADDEEDEELEDATTDGVPGITDEVLDFVTDISSRPEYWTDFPLALDDADFKMSDVQRVHASTVEQLIPNVSALRLKLQNFMSEEIFWVIYFILLLLRFNQHDIEFLSTPEIIEARDALLGKLQRTESTQVNCEHNCANDLVCGTQKGNMPSGEKISSTQVIRGGEGLEIHDREDTDHLLERAATKTSTDAKERLALEDISFSDIEDDGNDLSSKISVTKPPRASSPNESGDWVQLHENPDSKSSQRKAGKQKERDSEGEESSDWFNVDDFD